MEKPKTFIKRSIIVMFAIIMFLGFNGGISSPTKASSEGAILARTNHLLQENIELKREYLELVERVEEMEKMTRQIKEYDNVIYSQMLGIDFDTTGFYELQRKYDFKKFPRNDSIFLHVNERAFYGAEQLATQLLKLQETSDLFRKNKTAINYYPTISPIKTRDFITLSSPFGWREHPIDKKLLFHEGVDISANVGTKVYSTAQGRVVKIMYSKYGYGNRVVIQHGYGFETLYAHLDIIYVKRGQWIGKNQIIGTVGNSGKSTGSHLHYEIHKNGEPRDPLGYFYTDFNQEFLAMN